MRPITRLSFMLAAAVSLAGFARAADTQPTVTLVDAGSGAKSELRYDIPEGTAQKGTMSMKLKMTQTMGGMNMPAQAMPEMRTPVTITVLERLKDGFRFEAVMEGMEVIDNGEMPKQQIDMMRKMLGQIAGATARGVIDVRGQQRDVKVEMPSGVDPMIKQQADQTVGSMKQITMPLPLEAVGQGAKWTVEQSFDEGGLKFKQVATCVLKERKGSTVVLDIDIVQSADPQKLANPQMPGQEIDLQKFVGAGRATVTLDLTRAWPVESTIQSKVNMTMAFDMMGQTQTLDQVMESVTKIESEDPTKTTP